MGSEEGIKNKTINLFKGGENKSRMKLWATQNFTNIGRLCTICLCHSVICYQDSPLLSGSYQHWECPLKMIILGVCCLYSYTIPTHA